ncbi:MAG TPA: polyprenyl diphosphate synthase, partial [bacterium]|nr:polyprenyl diphosphate synthase [bacterium]
ICGHREGAKAVDRTVTAAREMGIRYLTLYAFSSENWKRPHQEIRGLFSLLKHYLKKELKRLKTSGIRFRAMGEWKSMPQDVVDELTLAIKETETSSEMDLIMALNYGGRQEILQAVQKIEQLSRRDSAFSWPAAEDEFRRFLYLPDVPDPDLLIRTSGENRVSNFLIWQTAYAEFYFTRTLWPDFGKADLVKAVREYQKRDRRFGGL